MIGSNNVGKSSILKALDYLLTDKKKISEHDYFCILNENKENQRLTDEVVITAEFRNVPIEAVEWKGFNRQRLFEYDVPEDSNETGLKIYYRKTYKLGSQTPIIEMQQYKLELKAQF